MTNELQQHILDKVLAGSVACQIGQINQATTYALDKMARKGRVAKWRGYWHPVAGAPFGIGPLKTCYGLPEVRDHFESFKVCA